MSTYREWVLAAYERVRLSKYDELFSEYMIMLGEMQYSVKESVERNTKVSNNHKSDFTELTVAGYMYYRLSVMLTTKNIIIYTNSLRFDTCEIPKMYKWLTAAFLHG